MRRKGWNLPLLLLSGMFVFLCALPLGAGTASSVIYFDIALDESRNLVYGSDSNGNRIDMIDMDSMAVVGSIPVGAFPTGLAVSPDGSELAVALYSAGEIAFIDLDTLTVIASVPPAGTSGANSPWDVIYGRPGRLYTSGNPGSGGSDYIHVFDTGTHTEVGRSASIRRAAPGLALTADGNTLYVGEPGFSPDKIYRYDVTTDTPLLTASGPHGPMVVDTIAVNGNGSKVYSSRGQVWSGDLQTQLGSFSPSMDEIIYVPGKNAFYTSGSSGPSWENQVYGYDGDTFAPVFLMDLGAKAGPLEVDAAEETLYVSTSMGLKRVGIDLNPQAYFPAVMSNDFLGIHGWVKDNGAAAAGVLLDLRFYNGSSWSTRASTVTDSQGMFKFLGMPALNANQYYYVRYLNDSDAGRLWTWHTALIDAYLGQNLDVGTFHIDDITLTSPASGAYVSVPRTFTWNIRPGLPTDSYEFNLFDYGDGNPYFWTDPPLGYVGSYTLQSLPPGFSTEYYYVWDMWVYDHLGGYGISYWARWIAFSNTGLVSVQVPSALVEKLEDLEVRTVPVAAP